MPLNKENEPVMSQTRLNPIRNTPVADINAIQ